MNRWHEFTQMVLLRFRDFYSEPEVICWTYGFPLIVTLALGIAFAGSRPEPPSVDVQGEMSDSRVRALAETLRQAGMKVEVNSKAESRLRYRTGKIALVVVPEGGGTNQGSKDGGLLFVLDETRAESALARKSVEAVLLRERLGSAALPMREESVQEPGSRYIDFLVPGLMGMNLMGTCLLGMGFGLVDMRARKLLKRFLATPMRRADFLLAILVARKVLLIPEMIAILAVGRLVFGVPTAGNPLTLILVILVGALAFNSLGLLPMYIFSGVFFSSKHFPEAAQPFIQALPLTQVNDALREVMLEGATLPAVAWRLGILLAWTVVPLYLALRWFRWR